MSNKVWTVFIRYNEDGYWYRRDIEFTNKSETDLELILSSYYFQYDSGAVLFCAETMEVYGTDSEKESFEKHYDAGILKEWSTHNGT